MTKGENVKRLSNLAKFEKLLREAGIHKFNIDLFESRLKLQKHVYLAQEMFGMKFDYPFNLYLRGPYSPVLAGDYYKLPEFEGELGKVRYDKNKFERFEEFVKGKNAKELEVIATTHLVWTRNKQLIDFGIYSKERLEELVVKKVVDLKKANENHVRNILKEIQVMG